MRADEDVLNNEILAEELNHSVARRRKAAREALDALSLLADLRAQVEQISRELVWKNIFDRDRLCAEIDGKDRARRRVAWTVLDALAEVAALRVEDGDTPLPLEHKVESLALWRKAQHMIEKKEREFGIVPKARLQN